MRLCICSKAITDGEVDKMTKKNSQKTKMIGTLIFMISLLLFPGHSFAGERTTTISHTDVTTTRGTANKTYYEGDEWGSNSTNHWGNDGDFFEVKFTGNKVSLYGNRNTTNGKGQVFIDDVLVGEVDYQSAKTSNVLLFTKENLVEGEHTIRVQAVGWINHVSTVVTYQEAEDPRQWVKKYDNLTQSDYTSHSWEAFSLVFNQAKTVVNNSAATVTELVEAHKNVDAAAKELVMNVGLKQSVMEYKTRISTDYDHASWLPFAQALTIAEAVSTTEDATNEAVVNAKNQLQTAADALVSTSAGQFESITNNTFWHDTDGNPIYSQGGGIFRFGDKYYWYGVRYVEAEYYYNNPTKIYNANSPIFYSITCYSSTDLVNWTFENNVATQQTKVFIDSSKNVSSDYFSRMETLADASWIGRLGVAYNEKTGKYTLLTQVENRFDPVRDTNACVLFLQGDSPTGDFKYGNIQTHIENAPVQGTGDQTLFTDDDGEDYLVFSGRNGRKDTLVSKISDEDSLTLDPGVKVGYVSSGREGNAMFKLNDRYHAASSDLHGWNTSVTYLISSLTDDIQGKYSNGYVLAGTEKDYSHVTQAGFFVKVKGTKEETVIYCGDRWADFAWNGLGYNQWVPISENESGLYFNSLSDWQLNATTGEWQVGDKNNFVLNPEFAADRIIVNQLTGWTNTIDEGSANFVSNVSPGANGSRFGLKLGADTKYSGLVTQENEIPEGTYQFSILANGAGDLDEAKVIISGADDEKCTLDLNQKTNGWQQFNLRNIRLSEGKVKIQLQAKSSTGTKYIQLDNLSLVKQTTDKTKLDELITKAVEIKPSQGKEFTEASKAFLETVIQKAQAVNENNEATQIQIDMIIAELTDAINGLVEVDNQVLPDNVELNITGIKTMKNGDSIDLLPSFSPNTTTEKMIEWLIDKPDLVKIDGNNKLIAAKTGTTKITAKTINGHTASFTIRITK